MESAPETKFQRLVQLMDAFISGEQRSRDLVAKIEAEFAACGLDDDDRYSDLQYALAVFGASERDVDEKMLVGECRYALRILRNKTDRNA